jgi:chromosomal replication initiator protein
MKQNVVSPYVYPGLNLKHVDMRILKKQVKYLKYSLTVDEILEIVSEECGIKVEDIVSKIRNKEVVNGRYIFCSIMKKYYGYPLKKIGNILGRDHTTIIHAIHTFRVRYVHESQYRDMTQRIYDRIGIQIN